MTFVSPGAMTIFASFASLNVPVNTASDNGKPTSNVLQLLLDVCDIPFEPVISKLVLSDVFWIVIPIDARSPSLLICQP